jgi:hypothetical protein
MKKNFVIKLFTKKTAAEVIYRYETLWDKGTSGKIILKVRLKRL